MESIPAKNEKPKAPVTVLGAEWNLPISIPEGEFYKLSGWLSETEIVYITNLEQTSSVYQYNLLSGQSKFIYKSDNPIVNVQISPSKKYLLIHSSPSSNEGLVTIIDIKGSELLQESFASYELVFEWNPYNESEILVTKFAEDWTFQVVLVDMKDLKISERSLTQPFIKWMNKKDIAFLNWDKNNPALVAPLIVKELENGNERTVFPSVVQFSAFRDLLMTVSVNDKDQSMAAYSFFDKGNKKVFSFSIPQLTRFSDWLVPFYDYNKHKGQFITFRPVKSGDADSYSEGFQLVTYNLKKEGSLPELVMEGLENAPVQFSPSGEALLYGNRFDKIIDIKTKKIYELIKE
ncbi:hypothetical protein [Neobacillus soli]|uniref:YqgU-like beta propeller domain-containing protein n=1 Tax=Neobacillus soli TaxID=220688 RepID=UPI00082677D6|nr:hypothetical protein [Neobacillus soli]